MNLATLSYRVLLTSAVVLFFYSVSFAQQQYTCPMHPHIIKEEMGTCPLCAMDLVPIEQEGEEEEGDAARSEQRTAIRISHETIQHMGVKVQQVEKAVFGQRIRSYGEAVPSERLKNEIAIRAEGWIESLKILAVGDEVQKGQHLFSIHSPALISAQQDYLSAVLSGNSARKTATRLRLLSLGLQERVIQALSVRRKSFELVPFYAQEGGVVSKLNVAQGSYVKSGMSIATIQRYSRIWINASVAEKDLSFIAASEKSQAVVSFQHLGNVQYNAVIDYIYPVIDKVTRTGLVRLVLANEQGTLRPGAYADVVFELNTEKRLAVPSSSVLKSSEGDFVVLREEDGRFRPVKITAGISSQGWTHVPEGLSEGMFVVTSGQFLIDSESSLRETFKKMQKRQVALEELMVSKTQYALINHALDLALIVHEGIIDGYDPDPSVYKAAAQALEILQKDFQETRLDSIIENSLSAVHAVQDSRTLSQLKASLNSLSTALVPWLTARKEYYTKRNLYIFTDEKDRHWLQIDSGTPYTPYASATVKQVFPEQAMEQEAEKTQ